MAVHPLFIEWCHTLLCRCHHPRRSERSYQELTVLTIDEAQPVLKFHRQMTRCRLFERTGVLRVSAILAAKNGLVIIPADPRCSCTWWKSFWIYYSWSHLLCARSQFQMQKLVLSLKQHSAVQNRLALFVSVDKCGMKKCLCWWIRAAPIVLLV